MTPHPFFLEGSAFASRPELSELTFHDGRKGEDHYRDGKDRLERWFGHRLDYGFSEFNSDTYGPIAYKAVVAVAGCAPDAEMRAQARVVMNLQLFDHILGSHGAKLATARGRAYSGGKVDSHIYRHMGLIKGQQDTDEDIGGSESSHYCLATLHGYRLPEVLLQVASSLRWADKFGPGEEIY